MKRRALPRLNSFSLVEMLATVAVLALLLVLIFSMVDSTSRVLESNVRNGDASVEARQVLDRMGADIEGMVLRPDVDQFFYNGSGNYNDAFFFYSQVPGYFPASSSSYTQDSVSLIGYRVNPVAVNASQPGLERLTQGLALDSANGSMTPLTFLTYGARSSVAGPLTANMASTITNGWSSVVGTAPYVNGTSPYYDAVGTDVFRMEVCFQQPNGTYTMTPPSSQTIGGLTNTVAMVVAIAVLDAHSRLLVPATSWTKLIQALPDPGTQVTSNPPTLMSDSWNSAIQAPGFAQSVGIPQLAAANIKIYQRSFYLNVPVSQ